MAVTRMRQGYCKKAPPFIKGDQIYLFTPTKPHRVRSKFHNYWTGPWTLDKQINYVIVKIQPEAAWVRKKPKIITVDRLKKFFPSENTDC